MKAIASGSFECVEEKQVEKCGVVERSKGMGKKSWRGRKQNMRGSSS